MNLLSLYIFAIALFSYPLTVLGTPAPNPTVALLANTSPQPTGTPWNFSLYPNRKCSGKETVYAGAGSTDCRTDIHTSAQGLLRAYIDPSCVVTIYKDKKCSKAQSIETISSYTTNKCNPWRKKRKVRSFKVVCS
ncbi:hypothetical protein N7528_005770 [Penicillium herquei]|nr:hypothetical protein N7528_005770 [Penicillium herquei]